MKAIIALLEPNPRPTQKSRVGNCRIEIYSLPGSKIRSVKADAVVVLVDRTRFIGDPFNKMIRDACSWDIQDRINELPLLNTGEAQAIALDQGPAKHMILANIFDENKLTNPELLNLSFNAIFKVAEQLKAQSLLVPDFTDEFNYFQKRTGPELAANTIRTAIERNPNIVNLVKVFIANSAYTQTYTDIFK